MRASAVVLTALLCAACEAPPTAADADDPLFECGGTESDDPRVQEVLTFLRGYLSERNVPGAAVAIVQGGQVSEVVVAGSKRSGQCDPVTPDTFFFTFLTQHLTAAAVHSAIADGDMSLDDPLVGYAPEFGTSPPSAGTPEDITLDHVLSHTSGLAVSATRSCLSIPGWLEAFDELPLWAPAGRIHQLQPINASFAALALERATETPYREAVRERVLDPLGITGTFNRLDAVKGDASGGFQEANSGLTQVPIELRECDMRDAYQGFLTSARGAIPFLHYLLEPDNPLLVTSGDAFFAPEQVTRGSMVRGPLDDGTEWVFAQVRSAGYGYDLRVIPEHDFGVIVFMNAVGGIPSDVSTRVVRIYTGARPLDVDSPQATSTYDGLVGTYRGLAGTVVAVARDGDNLTVSVDGGESFALVAAQRNFSFVEDLFEFEIPDSAAHQLRFWRDEDGTASMISENVGRNSLGTPLLRVE